MENQKCKEDILETFKTMVLKNGLKETKLDDISKALAISKKTIYKYFQSKDELVSHVIDNLVSDIAKIVDNCLKSDTNPVEKYIELIGDVEQYLIHIDQRFMQEIQENYPSLFTRMNEIRTQRLSAFYTILNDGIEKGNFKRINANIATQMMISSISAILNPAYLNQNSITVKEAITDLKAIFLTGILK